MNAFIGRNASGWCSGTKIYAPDGATEDISSVGFGMAKNMAKNLGTIWDFIGISWKYMGFYRNFMDIYGILMGISWKHMVFMGL